MAPDSTFLQLQEVTPERGMAAGPGNPVALIRVYLQYGKLKEAGVLALDQLRRWLYEVSNLIKCLDSVALERDCMIFKH